MLEIRVTKVVMVPKVRKAKTDLLLESTLKSSSTTTAPQVVAMT